MAALLWLSPHACGCLIGLCLDGCGCQSTLQAEAAPGSCCAVPTETAAAGCDCGIKISAFEFEVLPAPLTATVRTASPVVLWTIDVDFEVFRGSEYAESGFPRFGKPPNDPDLPFLQMWRC